MPIQIFPIFISLKKLKFKTAANHGYWLQPQKLSILRFELFWNTHGLL